MTISLVSNETRRLIGSTASQWMGTDGNKIEYPGLAICLSITCVINNKGNLRLAGAHLMPFCVKAEDATSDIKEFAEIARNPQSVYVVGKMQNWLEGAKKNRTGLAYDPNKGGGTLLTLLWQQLGYNGNIVVYDLATIGADTDVDLTADLISNAIQFYHGNTTPLDVDAGGTSFSGAEVPIIMIHPVKQGCHCIIV